MPREIPELSEPDRRRIAMVLGAWAEVHPRPHTPLIQLADGSELTPYEIARAAEATEEPRGRLIHRVFAVGAIVDDNVEPLETLDEILADFEHDTELWLEQKRERFV